MQIDSDEYIHSTYRTLQHYHDCTVQELGKNFYRNYAEFVAVAREAEKFETDLSAMRAMISQLKTFNEHISGVNTSAAVEVVNNGNVDTKSAAVQDYGSPALTVVSQTSEKSDAGLSSEDRARLKRIADLLPDSIQFLESSTAVYLESTAMAVYMEKQWKPAKIWLLSNGVLVASRKAKVSLTQGVRHRLTFERFLSIDDVVLSDVNDTDDLQNCFKLKNSQGSIFLHSEESLTKETWFNQISEKIQESHDCKAKESEKKTANLAGLVGKQTSSPTKTAHRRTASVCTSGATTRQSLELNLGLQELSPDATALFEKTLEDLSEAISCINYNDSVNLIEKMKYDISKYNFTSPKLNTCKLQLEEFTEKLVNYMFLELSDPLLSRENIMDRVRDLITLGYIEEVRERFLLSRTELIKSKIRRIQYNGNVFASLSLLSTITFVSIDEAFERYNSSFEDHRLLSGFITWARNEIARYCEIFSRQAFRRDLCLNIIAKCIEDSLMKCHALRKSGLDLSLFLQDCLGDAMRSALKSRLSPLMKQVDEAMENDTFDSNIPGDRPDLPPNYLPTGNRITSSFIEISLAMTAFMSDASALINSELSQYCAALAVELIDHFSKLYLNAFYQPARSNTEAVNLAADFAALANVLLPFVKTKFPDDCAELVGLHERLQVTSDALHVLLTENIAKSILPSDFTAYALLSESEDEALTSSWVSAAIPTFSRLSRDLAAATRHKIVDQTFRCVLRTLQAAFDLKLIKFRGNGLHKFTVDLKFLVKMTKNLLSQETCRFADELVENAALETESNANHPPQAQFDEEITKLEQDFARFAVDFDGKDF